jgi:hypothetical protein
VAALGPAVVGLARLKATRLNYITAALRRVRVTRVRLTVAGAAIRVRRNSLTIHDALNDTPNTCAFTADGPAEPQRAQLVRVTINSDAPRLLFSGALQKVDVSYTGRPSRAVYPCQAVDDTPRADAKLPFGSWTGISATTLAQILVNTFAPGFGTAHVQAGLPAVSVNLDGSEGMHGALAQIAKLIGGYFYWEDADLHLFVGNEPGDTPDPIDTTPHRLLDTPPITVSRDDSQLRTRAYGKGHGENTLADVAAFDTIVPIANAIMFTPSGGKAISLTQRLAYTGLNLGGGGTLVGPGVTPTAAPGLTLAQGTGIDTGLHQYAVTFITAVGETRAGPIAAINTGPQLTAMPDPTTALGAAPLAGLGIETGAHGYAYTWVTAVGETLPAPLATITHGDGVPNPATISYAFQPGSGAGNGVLMPNAAYQWAFTFQRSTDGIETGPSARTPTYMTTSRGIGGVYLDGGGGGGPVCAVPPVGWVRKWYRTAGNGSTLQAVKYSDENGSLGWSSHPFFTDHPTSDADLGAAAPLVNATALHQSTLTGIAVGPAGTIARRIYRTAANGAQLQLLATLNDNVTTTYTDAASDTTLGVNAPTANSTSVSQPWNQVAISGIPIGPSGTTKRYVYRTAANQSQLKLLSAVNDNATTGFTDSGPDVNLGVNAPLSDTSGLQQPAGQVNAGSSSILVAGTGAFVPTGGWAVIGNGTQVVRYTGIAGSTLVGIPASGPGAIVATIAYNSNITAAPILTGVTGLGLALKKGDPVNIWVQRDDLTAQAELAQRETAAGGVASDGIRERRISDERRGEASLTALCDADLKQFSRGIVTVVYATQDVKTKSGKPVLVNLPSPAINQTLTIQDVTITALDHTPGVPPTFTVTASNVRFSLDDLLRQLGGYLEGL